VITYFVTIFGIALVYTSLWNTSAVAFLPYLSAGILSWNFIANTFNESCRLFPAQAGILTNFKIPPVTFMFLLLLRQLFVLLYATIVHVVVLAYCRAVAGAQWDPLAFVLLPAGYLVMALALLTVSLPVAVMATRFRDLAPLINNLTYLMFLVTPILWKEEQLTGKAQIFLTLNPFVWILRTVRPLMLGQLPPAQHAAVLLGAIALLLPLSAYLYQRTESKLSYWVQ